MLTRQALKGVNKLTCEKVDPVSTSLIDLQCSDLPVNANINQG